MDASRSRCLDEITDLLYTIKDPDHLSNVHDWVVKLTTGEPSSLKTDYLRLLEYTLKSGEGVREPFVLAPPSGPLAGLSRLARPSRADCGRRQTGSLAAGGGGSSSENDDDESTAGLAEVLDRMDGETVSLQEFMADAQRYTCDGGRLMTRAADELLRDFRRTTAAAFDDRTLKLGDALAKEQVALLLRYRVTGQRMFSRAQILLDHLRELMPTFQYDMYVTNPDEHIRTAIAQRNGLAPPHRCDGAAAERSDDAAAAAAAAADDDDDSGSGALRKKMMCALNWLRSEVDRADCENATLGERYDVVVAAIADACKRKLVVECRAEAQKRDARNELDELRKRSAKQVALIDGYVEKIGSRNRVGTDKPVC